MAASIPLALQGALGACVFFSTFSIAGTQTSLGATLVLWIYFLARGAAPAPRRTMLDVPFLLFCAACLAAALLSGRLLESLSHLKNLLLIPAVYLVAFLAAASSTRRNLSLVLLVSGAASALYGSAIYLLGRGEGALGRSPGTFSNAMTFGGVLLLLCSLFLAAVAGPGLGRRWRFGAGAAALASLAALFFSFTRSSWIGMTVSAIVIIVFLRRRWLVPFAVALVVFVILLPAPYRARVESIWNPKFRTNVQRLELLRGGWSIFKDHWVVGVGTGDLGEIYARYKPSGAVHIHGHMHNIFLQVAVQMGIVGLAAFLWLLVSWFRLMGANLALGLSPPERSFVVGSIGALAGFVVNGLFEWNFGDAEVVTLLYLIVGANLALRLNYLRDGG